MINPEETIYQIERLVADMDRLDEIRKKKNEFNQVKISEITPSLQRLKDRGYITWEYKTFHPVQSNFQPYYLITLLKE